MRHAPDAQLSPAGEERLCRRAGDEARRAVAADCPPLADCLARAFTGDPISEWLFPSPRAWLRAGRPLYSLILGDCLLRGEVYTREDHAGAALWIPPQPTQPSALALLRFSLGGLWICGRAIGRVARLMEQLEPHRLREPHWYLAVLGTDPPQQGRGVGSMLLEPVLSRCDADGVPAYLESSREENVPFYERNGFVVDGEVRIRGGPSLWPMTRRPDGG